MKFTHFYYCPFTGLGLRNGYRGDRWLINRIKIFKEYVLPSLLKQKDIILWISWRPEEKENIIVQEFWKDLNGKIPFVFTFGGLCFYDDKYDDIEAKERLLKFLQYTLPKLEVRTDYVLMTIQPSDDIYLKDNTEIIQEKFRELLKKDKSTKKAVGWRLGYIMNYNTKEIAEYMSHGWQKDEISAYHTDTIPPFFTILFSKDEFLTPIKHFNHIGPYKSHEYIADYLNYTALEGRGFIVGTHGENISTAYNHRYKGRVLEKLEAEELMKRAGILESRPLKFKMSWRLKLRKIFNLLPFRGIISNMYHRLPAKYKIL